MSTAKRLLLVDDDADTLSSLAAALGRLGVSDEIYAASDAESAVARFRELAPPVLVLDLCLAAAQGPASGFAVLQEILNQDATCRVLVLTGHGAAEYGVRALHLGAANFLQKPADPAHLAALIKDAFVQAELRRSFALLNAEKEGRVLEQLVGRGAAAQELVQQVLFAAQTRQPVLICGETGTGKGLCAQVIHQLSSRASAPLVRFPPFLGSVDLAVSELFGHQKGAFTGAYENRRGLLAEAEGGTLLLDEVDELPATIQIMLLGVLQEKCYRSLGSPQEHSADVRLLAATNRDVAQCLELGRLRPDFYHRIAHVQVRIAPLRERKEDIPLLAEHFLQQLRRREALSVYEVAAAAEELLQNYEWPGNVRELAAVLEGAAFRAHIARRSEIRPTDVKIAPHTQSPRTDFSSAVNEFKLRLVRQALSRTDNNQAQAAKLLGVDRKTLSRLLAPVGA